MIPYDVDPSLHETQPAPTLLDDGFSPPAPDDSAQAPAQPASRAEVEAMLGEICLF